MKLAPLLVSYLKANKQLQLPGLGLFYYDNHANSIDTDTNKKHILTNNIHFEQKEINELDENLINHIAAETGKMKALATSDLESQLFDTIQFLNTGKPYHIAGIGTLIKKQNRNYEFFPERIVISEKKREVHLKNEQNLVPHVFDATGKRQKNLKPLITVLIFSILAISIAIWFYINKKDKKFYPPTHTVIPVKNKNIQVSNIRTVPIYYTYILETAYEPRASRRFNQLRNLKWPVELDTLDSARYNIIMKLPIMGSDTARIKDSLRILSGRAVYIQRTSQ